MTLDEMIATFDEFHDVENWLKPPWHPWCDAENKPNECEDISAMLVLQRLTSGSENCYANRFISGVYDGSIWFSADPEIVAANATREDICLLAACGVYYCPTQDGFHKFY